VWRHFEVNEQQLRAACFVPLPVPILRRAFLRLGAPAVRLEQIAPSGVLPSVFRRRHRVPWKEQAMNMAIRATFVAICLCGPALADDILPPNTTNALPPNTIDCAQFDKNGDAWKARGTVVFTLGDHKETLTDTSVASREFVFNDIDLFDLLEKKCGPHRG